MKDQSPTFVSGLLIGCLCTLGVLAAYVPPKAVKQETAQPQPPTWRTVAARVTAYCPCESCCGKWADGITSRGRNALETRGVAVDPKVISYGSMVTIPGHGTFVADDTGSAMRKSGIVKIDLRFPTHQEALNFGVKMMDVKVDGLP